jgi:hypothetical protein
VRACSSYIFGDIIDRGDESGCAAE